MTKRLLALAALGGLIALPACTSGQSGVEPTVTTAPLSANHLQFQVGTANYNGTVYLNTVVTFRQPNGLSALLDNTPNISLPFTNTAPATVPCSASGNYTIAGNDSGKNQITGTPQTNNGVGSSDPRTFPQSVGAFAYGFLASNSSTTGGNNSVFYAAATCPGYEGNRDPYYGPAVGITQRAFYVGPPYATIPNTGTTFLGYPSGFTTFALTPTTGTYSLTVGLPNASTPIPNYTSTTSLTNLTPMAAQATPAYATDGAGGGSVTVVVPPGATETAVFLRDISAATGGVLAYYTVVVRGAGPQTATIPSGMIGVGDTVSYVAVSFDYPAMEAVPMTSNPPQAPVINNSGAACTFSGTGSTCPGQADITVSPAGAATE